MNFEKNGNRWEESLTYVINQNIWEVTAEKNQWRLMRIQMFKKSGNRWKTPWPLKKETFEKNNNV